MIRLQMGYPDFESQVDILRDRQTSNPIERAQQVINGEDIIAVPLQDESDMQIGYLTHRRGMRSRLGETYLAFLKEYLKV